MLYFCYIVSLIIIDDMLIIITTTARSNTLAPHARDRHFVTIVTYSNIIES